MKEMSVSLKDYNKIECDYKFDKRAIVSKQKWLKLLLQKSIMDRSVKYLPIHLVTIRYSNTKKYSTPWEIL